MTRQGLYVRAKGVEPPHLAALDPKSSVSTSSTTPAKRLQIYPQGMKSARQYSYKKWPLKNINSIILLH